MDFGCLFDDKYKIIKLIGSGGCGRVYLAENTRTKDFWAIKEIPCDDTNIRQVEREVEVLKKIRHPALPRIVDVLREEGVIYLIEDYFEGRNVEEILKECKRVDFEVAVQWAYEICDIMIFLHGQTPDPIIYRDLKPSNIILSPEGSLKLVDFGSVRHYRTDSPSDTVYIGTRGYAAPEQYGSGQTTKQSDVYSFGITMLRLVTGKFPANAVPGERNGGAGAGAVANAGAGTGESAGVGAVASAGAEAYYGAAECDIDSGDYSERATAAHNKLFYILKRCIEINPINRYQDFITIKSELCELVQPDSAPATRSANSLPNAGNASAPPYKKLNAVFETPRYINEKSHDNRHIKTAAASAPTPPTPTPIPATPAPMPAKPKPEAAFPATSAVFATSAPPAAAPAPPLPRPIGVYRCATISVTQNHEFAFEFAHRAWERYGLKTFIIDIDFETTFSEFYFTSGADKDRSHINNSLYQTIEIIENAVAAIYRDDAFGSADAGAHSDRGESPQAVWRYESPLTGIDFFSGFTRGGKERPELVWLNEPNPEYSGMAAEKLTRDRGRILRLLLSEVTVYADVCILLTGCSLFSELNLRCFQNSHYIICPGRADTAAVKTFKNTSILAERFNGVAADRFKYVIWDYKQNDFKPDVTRELAEESLAGVVRKSRRRENTRRGGAFCGCYAYSMERTVKRDYDAILAALGLTGNG